MFFFIFIQKPVLSFARLILGLYSPALNSSIALELLMQPNHLSKQSDSGRKPCRLLLSVGLPLVLLLAFLGKQIINFDSIGWSNGFSHPLMGWDHLVTMLAVGVWAAQLRGQAIWMLPLAFVGVMSLGGLAGAAGLAIPSVEGIILLSCAVFSVLITRKVRFSAQVNVLIVAFFAFFHGFAHGQEISTSASLISYTLGFMLATLLLHGAGILVAKLVVFGVTCLLTAMFANAALAKTADSIREDNPNGSSSLVRDAGEGSKVPFRMIHAKGGLDHKASLFQQRVSVADSEYCRDTLNNAGSARSPIDLKLLINASPDADKSHGLIAKQQPAQVLCLDRAIFDGDHLVDAGLDFKHYYRDVNHTPGKHLLSNGVGLTSPPVCHVLAPQEAPNNLRNTSIPSIEEPHLQSIFAKFDTGNPYTKTINHYWHDYAASPCVAGFVSSSINNFGRPILPVSQYSGIQLPTAASKTLAVGNVGPGVGQLVKHHLNITIKIKEI
jgi:urease accessory protein